MIGRANERRRETLVDRALGWAEILAFENGMRSSNIFGLARKWGHDQQLAQRKSWARPPFPNRRDELDMNSIPLFAAQRNLMQHSDQHHRSQSLTDSRWLELMKHASSSREHQIHRAPLVLMLITRKNQNRIPFDFHKFYSSLRLISLYFYGTCDMLSAVCSARVLRNPREANQWRREDALGGQLGRPAAAVAAAAS